MFFENGIHQSDQARPRHRAHQEVEAGISPLARNNKSGACDMKAMIPMLIVVLAWSAVAQSKSDAFAGQGQAQCGLQIANRLPALVPIFGKASLQHPVQSRGRDFGDRRRGPLHHLSRRAQSARKAPEQINAAPRMDQAA
jgi:hypothetical protein